MTTQFRKPTRTSTFRRIAASMWHRPMDPTIYGFVDIDVTDTLAFIARTRKQTGRKLTMTHVVAHAAARALGAHPELNAKVRHWGKLEQREHVDLFISVATEGGKDLSGARIEGAENLSIIELVDAVASEVDKTRKGTDETIRKSRTALGRMPWWMVRPSLWLTDLLSNELNLHLPSLGMPRDPFGSAVITNVGMFGIDTAFAPFVPLGRCPMLLLLTEVKERAIVVDGRVEARPVLRLCATFDHRVIDGFQAGQLSDIITSVVANPAGELAAVRRAS